MSVLSNMSFHCSLKKPIRGLKYLGNRNNYSTSAGSDIFYIMEANPWTSPSLDQSPDSNSDSEWFLCIFFGTIALPLIIILSRSLLDFLFGVPPLVLC